MIKPSSILSRDELNTVRNCLVLATGGEYFPEWEFPTIFGLELSEVRTVLKNWPNVDLSNDITRRAVKGSLGHLRGYPHGKYDEMERIIGDRCEHFDGISQKLKNTTVIKRRHDG